MSTNPHAPPSALDERPDRMAPHNVEAEEAVLGAILLDAERLYDVAPFLLAEDFFIIRHEWIYRALLKVHEGGGAIDYLTLIDQLRREQRLDEVGGPAYLTYLINHTPVFYNAESYGRRVHEAAVRRRMLGAASEIAQAAYDEDEPLDSSISTAEKALASAVDSAGDGGELSTLAEASSEDFDEVAARYQRGGQMAGLPTGYADLDALLGGLQDEALVIVAGRPGMGKTSFLLNLAVNVARVGGRPAVVSLEMSRDELVRRFKSIVGGPPTEKMKTGRMSESEWAAYVQASSDVAGLEIRLLVPRGLTPAKLRASARRLVQRSGVKLLLVDYVQLMHGGRKFETRQQEVSYLSASLKALARELEIPVVAAAQLNRDVESRADKHPLLSDLRESGSLEQDSDVVLFLYRDEVYNEATERPSQADVIIAKHRSGPTGIVPLFFREEHTQFSNLTKTMLDLKGY